MRETRLFNDSWEFIKAGLEITEKEIMSSNDWKSIDIPHDWLIYNSNDLYENSQGWYRKTFNLVKKDDICYAVRFEGVYMDSTVYVNGVKAGEWKYGYNTFEFEITDLLKSGDNQIMVKVLYEHPNSRWYSGAGIYRNIWFLEMPKTHFVSDGMYIRTEKTKNGYNIKASAEAVNTDKDIRVNYYVIDKDGNTIATEEFIPNETEVIAVKNPNEWSIDNPYLYSLRADLMRADKMIDSCTVRFGFRTIDFNPEKGFFLNGVHTKLNGMCMHHDLGALGAAVNRTAIKRQLTVLKQMGVNAVRTSHNMPAVELMELADEMGMLIDAEFFDMWRIKKTDFDYARFFDKWAAKDVRNFVRRDRNHPSVIMWSIGNEIYDTHADPEEGYKTTKMLRDEVLKNDPDHNAYATFGSNFLEGEATQNSADLLKLVGYNYSERLYKEHHKKHPDWCIYGSETGSTLQSRSVYHFPYSEQILTDLDEQCSSLGNSTCSWGAKNTEFCIITERDTEFSAGQFVWTGFDYIGEPTPYQTKNSYFGQVDTAGFPKDTYYIYQSAWTDYRRNPMVHLFPYWDFNEGQLIDVRVTSNAPKVELFLNGKSMGTFDIDHEKGTKLLGHWQIPYEKGKLEAVAYDENNIEIARDVQESFSDAAQIAINPDKTTILADGQDMVFAEINMLDKNGHFVRNANNRVEVNVSGAGRLVGLDNGDSTDYDSYKGTSRRLFMGKLLAMVAANTEPGDITITVKSQGMKDSTIVLNAIEAPVMNGIQATTENILSEVNTEVPIRKIEIISNKGLILDKDTNEMELKAVLYPADCTCNEVEWVAVNDAGVKTNLAEIIPNGTSARLIAKGDGHFNVRCYTKNGKEKVSVISQLGFSIENFGSAYINPYEFVSAALYNVSEGELGNAEEHGVATAKHAVSYLGFENVDFGDFGTDEIELPIFTFNQEDFQVQIWSGIPESENSELLADVIYNKPVIWGVYQPETYKLNKRIKGVHTICIRTKEFLNLKGFTFTRLNKGTEMIFAGEHDKIYGDAFEVSGNSVNGIGNNVSIEFAGMDFKDGVNRIEVCGNSYIDVNTINMIFADETGKETRQMLEFTHSEGVETRTFDITPVKGMMKVIFVFLPGSKFDFDWFRFIPNEVPEE